MCSHEVKKGAEEFKEAMDKRDTFKKRRICIYLNQFLPEFI